MKIIIWGIIFYLIYRYFRSLGDTGAKQKNRERTGARGGDVIDLPPEDYKVISDDEIGKNDKKYKQ